MRASKVGRDLIRRWEGAVHEVYLDAAGYPTAGVGHLLSAAERATMPPGTTVTDEQVDAWLTEDVEEAEALVRHYIQAPLGQYEFDALVSLAFNLGPAPLIGTLGKKLNAGDREGAAGEFWKWRMAGGQVLTGLRMRRAAEEQLFRTPDNVFVQKPWEEWSWDADTG